MTELVLQDKSNTARTHFQGRGGIQKGDGQPDIPQESPKALLHCRTH